MSLFDEINYLIWIIRLWIKLVLQHDCCCLHVARTLHMKYWSDSSINLINCLFIVLVVFWGTQSFCLITLNSDCKATTLLPRRCRFSVRFDAVCHYSDCNGEKSAAGELFLWDHLGKMYEIWLIYCTSRHMAIFTKSHHPESIRSNGWLL